MGFYRLCCRRIAVTSLLASSVLMLMALRHQDAQLRTAPKPIAQVSLTCEEIARIGHWSEQKFGGLQKDAPESDLFRDRALKLYLEKLDPHKILLTQADVAAFEKEGRRAWPGFVQENRCQFYQTWATDALPRFKKRFQANLKALPIDGLFPAKVKADDSESETRFPRFAEYAKDDAELSLRLKKIVQRTASAVTKSWLGAYRGNRRHLIEDSMEQQVFGENVPSPKLLLIKAYLGAIDPYSTYFSASEFEDFYHDLAGGTSGVGIKVRRVPLGLLIEKLVKDSPADRSKSLHPGDIITQIDGLELADLPPLAAKHLLKGAENTTIQMKVQKGLQGRSRTVVLRRRHFSFEDARVTYKLIDSKDLRGVPAYAGIQRMPGKIAVIEVPSFYGRGGMSVLQEERSSAEDLREVLEELLKSKTRLSAVVLDLRGNPGGFLEEAVAMGGLFLGDRPVVAVLENHHRRVLRDALAKPLYTGPLVVLTDGQSASASEVLAGALKDHQRALIVGASHTYGKGSVQKLFHLQDEGLDGRPSSGTSGAVVKLTTSVFFSPLGHSPANGGVSSHITLPAKVTPDDEDEAAPPVKYGPVADQSPFVDEASLRDLEAKQRKLRLRLTALEKRSGERTKDIQALIDTSFKKALGIGNRPEPEEYGLAEAVAIASDFVQMESPLLSNQERSEHDSQTSVASPRPRVSE